MIDTNNLGREIARSVRVDWNPARVRAAEVGLHERRRRRAIVRGSAIAAVALTICVLGLWSRSHSVSSPDSAPAPVATAKPPHAAPTIAPVAAIEPTKSIDVVELSARGDVFETTDHPLRVTARSLVTIDAASAKFAASYVEHRVKIEVFVGSVLVAWGDQHQHVGAGETVIVPPETKRATTTRVTSATSWRDLARDGEYDKAYAALARPDAAPIRDVADELLLAADVKRLSKHADEAVAPLRQILRDHASDSRAPLAAFTLGRVLLELRRPAEAADAFASADRLAPTGPMAQDAIAREVEARSLANDRDGARRAAEEYVRRYPDGRKLRSVRAWGGLE